MWTVPAHPTGADATEDPLEEGQQPHKDHLAETPMVHASSAANKDTLPGTAP